MSATDKGVKSLRKKCMKVRKQLLASLTGMWVILAIKIIYFLNETRFLAGITGGGVFICIPLFIAEIASDQ